MVTVLLAAGKASRMGTSKLILPFQGKPILAYALEAALQSSTLVVIVTGFHEKEILTILDAYTPEWKDRLTIVRNPNPGLGQFSSAIMGVEAIPEGEDFAISLGDAPLVTSAHYERLQPLLPGHEAVRPYCEGVPGHPVLCAASLRKTILKLPVSYSMRELLQDREVIRLDTDDPAWITDIDTPEAYQKLVTQPSVDSSI